MTLTDSMFDTSTAPTETSYRCTGMAPPRQASTGNASDYVGEWSDLRAQGLSYREIAERYGFSHERVRQVVGHLQIPSPAKTRQHARAHEIAEWLETNGPIPLSRLQSELGVTERQLISYAKKVPGVIPLHLVILNSRPTVTRYSRADLVAALREVWSRVPVTDRIAGLSHTTYDRLRRRDQPSSAQAINRLGRWEIACEAAGISSGTWTRPKETYASRWSEEDLLDIVATYTRRAGALGVKPTYLGYERYQLGRDDLPSGTTVRNRMRASGLGTWPAILERALGRSSAS